MKDVRADTKDVRTDMKRVEEKLRADMKGVGEKVDRVQDKVSHIEGQLNPTKVASFEEARSNLSTHSTSIPRKAAQAH
jgi:predicted  nucleic acid-binding Zn-ribbon protein